MKAELLFTSDTLFYLSASILIFLTTFILLGRYYMNKKGDSDLSKKYRDADFSSPLVGRNKYPDVDVFSFRSQFLLLGLVLSLFIMVGAFGFTSYEKQVVIPEYAFDIEEDIEIEPPRSAEPPPPPPPPPPPVITEVPNETILEEEQVEFLDQSVEANTAVIAPEPLAKVKKESVVPPPPPPPPVEEPEVVEIFKVVESMPLFPGCEQVIDKKERYACSQKRILEFVYSHIKYPSVARENNIEGTVVVRFVVNESGKVNKIELLKDIGGKCGEEALRVISLMNSEGITWHPGAQRGKPVKVWMNLPIRFKLIT